MQALASPRSATPTSQRGVGNRNRSRRICADIGVGDVQPILLEREARRRVARRAGDEYRVAGLRAAALAAPRRWARCRSSCTVMDSGPRVVSPPTSATPCRRHRSPAARANCASQASSGLAAASARAAPRRAPRPWPRGRDRFTAKARWPIDAGGEPGGKCTPSTSVSVTTTSSREAGGISTAPSSPTPMRTSARSAPSRAKYLPMSSNSDCAMSAIRRADSVFVRAQARARPRPARR